MSLLDPGNSLLRYINNTPPSPVDALQLRKQNSLFRSPIRVPAIRGIANAKAGFFAWHQLDVGSARPLRSVPRLVLLTAQAAAVSKEHASNKAQAD